MKMMKKIFPAILFVSLNVFAAHVAVLETIGDANTLDRNERLVLTDKLRQIAVTILPNYMGYTIMTRENINVMLPPGKAVEDCEGSCLVETGKNISADYVAQARISKFGSALAVTVELYETASGKLMASYVGQGTDAMELMLEIEKRSPSLFSVVKGQQAVPGSEKDGFSQIQQGSSFALDGNKLFLIKVDSKPSGAMLSVDGRPKCKSTPCNLQLPKGSHNFSFALEKYFAKDTSFDVSENEQMLNVRLISNFGKLEIIPKLKGEYAKVSELTVLVDGKKQNDRMLYLNTGVHHIELSHHCYEPLSFDVTIKNGSELKFDKSLEPAKGGLSLTAEGENGPMSIPVFVNDEQKGKTPFYESVPICAQINAGKTKESIPVKLKYHKTVEFVYKKKSDLLKDKDGNTYKTVKIGKQVWMAENLKVKAEKGWLIKEETSVCRGDCERNGRFYTWDDAKKSCPAGWHLPSKEEFGILFASVSKQNDAGDVLKSTQGWGQGYDRRDGNGTDQFGFTVFPVGYIDCSKSTSLQEPKQSTYFWSSTEGSHVANHRPISIMFSSYYRSADFYSNFPSCYKLSVRCIKD